LSEEIVLNQRETTKDISAKKFRVKKFQHLNNVEMKHLKSYPVNFGCTVRVDTVMSQIGASAPSSNGSSRGIP